MRGNRFGWLGGRALLRVVVALGVLLAGPMAPAGMAGSRAHGGHQTLAASHSTIAGGATVDAPGGSADPAVRLTCAVMCAGAPDPLGAVAPLAVPVPLRAPAVRSEAAPEAGMALAPLRRPPKHPTA